MNTSNWILRMAPRPNASLRLFCLPHAGADGVIFRDWAAQMPAHVELCAVMPPGHFSRRSEPLLRDMRSTIGALDVALDPYLDIPFAILGYSLGALLAFEWARSLRRRRKLQPEALIVAAARAPQSVRRQAPIAHEPRAVFQRELENRYGAIDAAIKSEPDLLALVLDITRADIAILESYRHEPEPPFDCKLVAIGGRQDKGLDEEGLGGWSVHTRGSFGAHWLPGGHFFLRSATRELLTLVGTSLERPNQREAQALA